MATRTVSKPSGPALLVDSNFLFDLGKALYRTRSNLSKDLRFFRVSITQRSRRKLLHWLPIIVGIECGDGLGCIRGVFPEILFKYNAILVDEKRHHS